jgi:hypothetical protein
MFSLLRPFIDIYFPNSNFPFAWYFKILHRNLFVYYSFVLCSCYFYFCHNFVTCFTAQNFVLCSWVKVLKCTLWYFFFACTDLNSLVTVQICEATIIYSACMHMFIQYSRTITLNYSFFAKIVQCNEWRKDMKSMGLIVNLH